MLNLDTHMIIYLLAGDLTSRETQLILKEDLAISHIVLWELAKLVQMRRLDLDLEGREFQDLLLNVNIVPISFQIARKSTQLDFRADPPDEIIAATSIVEGIALLTRDRTIRKSKIVPFAN